MKPTISQGSNGTLTVTGAELDWLERAIEHQLYLDTYRKQYSKTRRAKVQAIRSALEAKGVDIKRLEAEAVAKVRASQK